MGMTSRTDRAIGLYHFLSFSAPANSLCLQIPDTLQLFGYQRDDIPGPHLLNACSSRLRSVSYAYVLFFVRISELPALKNPSLFLPCWSIRTACYDTSPSFGNASKHSIFKGDSARSQGLDSQRRSETYLIVSRILTRLFLAVLFRCFHLITRADLLYNTNGQSLPLPRRLPRLSHFSTAPHGQSA